jgi:hypothetical protein
VSDEQGIACGDPVGSLGEQLVRKYSPPDPDFRRCLRCTKILDAGTGFYELYRQPDGDLYTLCSLDCLTAFAEGRP